MYLDSVALNKRWLCQSIKKQCKTEQGRICARKGEHMRPLRKTMTGNAITHGQQFISRKRHWNQRCQWSFCLSVTINDNSFSMNCGPPAPRIANKVSKKALSYLRCAKVSCWKFSGAMTVQEKPNGCALPPITEDISDLSWKAAVLFSKKTFQWLLLRIWNMVRIISLF